MWFDTHAHLSDPKFDADRDEVAARAFSSGLSAIVEIADGPEEWPKARALAEKYPGKIWWAAGLHPYYADKSSTHLWSNLKESARHPQFVAVGEIGLDYAKCPIPPDQQKVAFHLGIETGLEIDKPLIIHCRDAYADLLPILQSYWSRHSGESRNPGLKPDSQKNVDSLDPGFRRDDAIAGLPAKSPGVIHCFSGNREQANELIEMGFYLGIDGPLTYPNAKNLREALSGIPLERLVLETDSPYLPPQAHRGQRNEPSYLPQVGAFLATLRNMDVQQLAQIISESSFRLFRLKHPS